MARCKSKFLLILYFYTILMISTQQAFALICYTCDSLVDEYCDDKFDPDLAPKNATVKCGRGEVCVKLKFKIGSFPKPLVRRECNAPTSSDFHTITSLGQFNQCKKDKCNGSTRHGSIGLFGLLIAIPMMMFLL